MSSVVYSTYSPAVFHPQMEKRIFRSNGLSITLVAFISHKLLPTFNESKETNGTSEQYQDEGRSAFYWSEIVSELRAMLVKIWSWG